MRRKVSIACLIAAWLCANGAIWNTVQVVAWIQMFREYKQVMPATQALQFTFDGSAPCELCKVVQGARDAGREENPPAPAPGAERLLLALSEGRPIVLLAPRSEYVQPDDQFGRTWSDTVPVPPPRA